MKKDEDDGDEDMNTGDMKKDMKMEMRMEMKMRRLHLTRGASRASRGDLAP